MKISKSWLKELVVLDIEELIRLLPLRTIALKEVTENYIELDMKGYNRADLLSLRGVANEAAAITDSKVNFEDTNPNFPELNKVKVEITNENLCPVYCVAKIENLKVADSNETWVKKLNDCGIRAVNNIADVTNLVMLEYGQPMHAFDAKTVEDETIVVRTAKADEKLITLDNKERILTTDDLLIADPKKAIGLAGVMGGKNTEVTNSTSTILLEAAIFDPVSNRKSSKKHGLYSEATKRFQHGLTKTNLLQAFDTAIKMYEGLGGKLTAISLSGDLEDETKTVNLTQEKVNSLIGIEIQPEEVESSLQKLGFKLASHTGSGNVNWEVTVPYWRLDINIEEDLIEEVARMYGYEKIGGRPLENAQAIKPDQGFYKFIYDLKKTLQKAGLTEVQTYSFYSSAVLDNLNLEKNNLLKIANPISQETEYMRDNLWPNLVEAAAKNIRNGIKDIAIFEIGKTYQPQMGELPKENYHLSIALCNGTDNPIAELNQIFHALPRCHLDQGATLTGDEYFHPTRHTDIMAEIHPRIMNKFGIEQRIAVLEIELTEPQ